MNISSEQQTIERSHNHNNRRIQVEAASANVEVAETIQRCAYDNP